MESDTITHRGVKGKVYPVTPGETFTDKGYLRVSHGEKGEDTSSGFFHPNMPGQQLVLTIPKGTTVLPGSHTWEGELFLPRGSTIKVVKTERVPNGWTFVNREEVEVFIDRIHATVVDAPVINDSRLTILRDLARNNCGTIWATK